MTTVPDTNSKLIFCLFSQLQYSLRLYHQLGPVDFVKCYSILHKANVRLIAMLQISFKQHCECNNSISARLRYCLLLMKG